MYIVVFVTAKNVRQANRIATELLKGKLIACANIVKDVRSIFTWKGKVDKASEVLLILKAKKSCFSKIVTRNPFFAKFQPNVKPEIPAPMITIFCFFILFLFSPVSISYHLICPNQIFFLENHIIFDYEV